MPCDAEGVINPARLIYHIPKDMKGPKRGLIERMAQGNAVATVDGLNRACKLRVPVAGSRVGTRRVFDEWTARGRPWIYRDRGYMRRGVFSDAAIPRGKGEGYWRFHLGAFQMEALRDVPIDRFERLKVHVRKWAKGGRHILVAAPSDHYAKFHGIEDWTQRTVQQLRRLTDRPISIRHKHDRVPLPRALDGAHALVTHGSVAAVEAAVLGIPVFVDRSSAASHVGLTDLSQIETPVYPGRRQWLASLAYSQFNEREMLDGTVWRLMA